MAIAAALIALGAVKGSRIHRLAGFFFIFRRFFRLLELDLDAPQRFPRAAVYGGFYCHLCDWWRLVGFTLFEVVGLVIFLRVAFSAVTAGVIPPIAPFVIAAIPLILIAGNLTWFFRQRDRARLRVLRHLNRMVWGLVVVIRAPIVEIAAAGVPIPQVVTIIGPIILALAMIWYFRRRALYGPRRSSAGVASET